jgi:hypothetical protein
VLRSFLLSLMPNIYVYISNIDFDSWDHLLTLLDHTDFGAISNAMIIENARARTSLELQWSHVIDIVMNAPPGK